MEKIEHVNGENKGKIMLYALSTCGWCRKTKELLGNLGVEYSYVYVDLLEEDDQSNAMDEVKHWNPRCSFPTTVINDKTCIVGFKEDEIKKALKI
jgi:glutaredoxin